MKKITELETIAFSKGMKQGMIVSITNIMAYIRKEEFTQTEIGKIIFNFCEKEKEKISKEDI